MGTSDRNPEQSQLTPVGGSVTTRPCSNQLEVILKDGGTYCLARRSARSESEGAETRRPRDEGPTVEPNAADNRRADDSQPQTKRRRVGGSWWITTFLSGR